MKKKILLIIILLIFANNNIFSINNLSVSFLVSKNWVSDATYGISIIFENDNKCIVIGHSPFVREENHGTYVINNNKLGSSPICVGKKGVKKPYNLL